MTFANYVKVEKIMAAWYNAGKLQATGHGKNTAGNPGDDLSHKCKTIDFAHDDYVAMAQVTSGTVGVAQIKLQTRLQTMVTLSDETDTNINARYAFLNANWENFDQNVRNFYGFYGTNKANGDMASIGFIGKVHTCWSQFTSTNPTTLTWTSPTLGTVTRPTLPADYQAYLDAKGTQTASAGAISATSTSS